MARRPLVEVLYESQFTQIIIALVVNGFYAAVLGASLLPSAWILAEAASAAFGPGPGAPDAGGVALLAFAAGAAVFAYFLWGALFQAALIRLLSLGIKPGRYPKVSLTTVRWLIFSGIYNLSLRSILPFIPVSWFCNAYFLIVGAKIGRNVYLNSAMLADAYLLELGDGVVIGGGAEISCHLMEKDWLHLEPVRIGAGSLVGTGAYVPPGTVIGERCTVGARCYLRKGTVVPDGTVLTVVAGMPVRDAIGLEKRRERRDSR